MKRLLLALSIGALFTCSAGAGGPAAKPAAEPTIRFEKFTLPNGLEVILAPDRRLPLVTFNLWVHAGPRNEAAGQTGFAHLFEHLMFAGTKHIPRGQADRIVDAAGGTDSNGTTNFDRTNYFFTLPSNRFETGLWIKSDMLGYMIDEVDQTALTNQQDVVRNERRQRTENRPYGIADEAVFQALFPPGHPYRAAVIGSHADIQRIRLEDVHAFARTYYRPNNATLVLAGDFDPARAKARVRHWFGSLKAGAPVPQVNVPQPVLERTVRVTVKDRVELPRLTLAWHTPAAFKPGDAELDLAAMVLGGGKSSRLYQKLVYEKQLAQSVEASQYSASLGSVFSIEVVARPGRTLTELEAAVDEELAALRRDGPSAAELARAQAAARTRLVQSVEKLAGRADLLNFYNQYTGDPGFLPRDLARYRNASAESVRAAVTAHLPADRRVAVLAEPGEPAPPDDPPAPPPAPPGSGGKAVAINDDQPWRAKEPAAGAAPRPTLPAGRRFTLPNGLTVVHVHQPQWPLFSAALVLRAGQDRNPPGRPGLAGFAASMLEQGTATRSAKQIADAAADLGVQLVTAAGAEAVQLRVSGLADQAPPALALVADLALNPAFADDEIARLKARRTDALLRQREDIGRTADVVARAAYYGPEHPLGASALGDEAAIAATTRAELQGFWRTHARPDRAALVVVGSLDEAAARRLAVQHFGGWKSPAEAAPAAAAAPAPRPTAAKLVLVDKPGASQTALQVVGPGPGADAPDAAAAEVMNNALGGLFTSRINHQLREVKGYTYGVYSRFAGGRSATHWTARGNVRGDVTAPALADLLAEVDGVRAAPLPGDELARARNASLLSLPGLFDTNDAVADRLAGAWSLGHPADFWARWPGRLAAVDAAAAQAAARAHVAPASLKIIAVGDLAKVRAPLEALQLGPVELRDADGRVKR